MASQLILTNTRWQIWYSGYGEDASEGEKRCGSISRADGCAVCLLDGWKDWRGSDFNLKDYNKERDCRGCLWDDICPYGPPCHYYTPYESMPDNDDWIIRRGRLRFYDEWREYIEYHRDDGDLYNWNKINSNACGLENDVDFWCLGVKAIVQATGCTEVHI